MNKKTKKKRDEAIKQKKKKSKYITLPNGVEIFKDHILTQTFLGETRNQYYKKEKANEFDF